MNEISTMQSIVNDNTIGSRGSVYNYCLAKRIEYIVLMVDWNVLVMK